MARLRDVTDEIKRQVPAAGKRWRPAPFIRVSIGLHAACLAGLILWPEAWRLVVAALVVDHAALSLAGFFPRSRLLGPTIVRLPDEAARRGEVALTFDDGPDPLVTPRVLDLLDRHGARASFFCVGERATRHPALVREIVRRGHSVENHSHRHAWSFGARLPSRIRRELAQAQAAIAAAAGTKPRFVRAPFGFRSPFVDPALAGASLPHVAWTRRGYDTVCRDPATVLRRLLRGLAAGDVLLLHDGASARMRQGEPVVLAVLPGLLDALARRGLRAVSLPMAFSSPTATPEPAPPPPAAAR